MTDVTLLSSASTVKYASRASVYRWLVYECKFDLIVDVVFPKEEDNYKVDANEVIHMKLGICMLASI